MNLFRHSPEHQDPKLVEKSIQAWSKMMLIVEQQLEKKQELILQVNTFL